MSLEKGTTRIPMSIFGYICAASLVGLVTFSFSACGNGDGGAGSNGETWQYVAMGDSLAVGVLADRGYVERYRGHINSDTGATVAVANFAMNGWQSSDLLSSLTGDIRVRSALRGAQVITWDIGGNDLRAARLDFIRGTCGGADNQDCLRNAVERFKSNWDATVAEILSLRSPNTAILRTMDIYNPFVAADRLGGRFAILNAYLDEVNDHITASAARNGIPCARVHEAFNGTSGEEDPVQKGLISVDGLHPNDLGHEAIAAAFRSLGYAPLR